MLETPEPRQILEALRYAIKQPEEVAEIVERAYQLLTSRFNWPNIAERTLALYEELREEQQNGEHERWNALCPLRAPDEEKPRPVINLVRLSRGKMHGVDHNRDLTWVGGTIGIWPED